MIFMILEVLAGLASFIAIFKIILSLNEVLIGRVFFYRFNEFLEIVFTIQANFIECEKTC